MFKSFILSVLVVAIVSQRVQVNDFKSLTDSLFQGNPIRFIAKYSQCYPSMGNAVGGNQIDTFQYFNDPMFGGEFLAFSGAKLISNYQGQGFVYDYVKQTIYPNGTIVFMATDVYTTDYSPVYEETFVCQIDESVKFRLTRKEQPRFLASYDELIQSLFNGEEVSFVNSIQECPHYIGPFGDKAPNTVQGTTIQTFEHFNDQRFFPQEFFAFSDQKLIKNFQGKGFVQNIDEFKVWKNGTVHVRMHALNAVDYSLVFSEWIECTIANDVNGKGVKFYSLNSAESIIKEKLNLVEN